MVASRRSDWRDTIGDILRDGRARGLPATELARLAREKIADGNVSPGVVGGAFLSAFGVPFPVMKVIGHWREFNSGSLAISDEEFELALAPWMVPEAVPPEGHPVYEPDWRGTVVESLREGKERGLSGADLGRLALQHLGDGYTPAAFKVAFFHAFGVYPGLLHDAMAWHEIDPGPGALSDEEFEEELGYQVTGILPKQPSPHD